MKLHLPKLLLTAVMATMTFVATTANGADSISVNFTSGDGGKVTADMTGELGGIAASAWNNVNGADTAGTQVRDQNGDVAATLSISNVANSWHSNVAVGSTLTSGVQYGYIDVPNHTSRIYTIGVGHDYWLTDVTFYMSNDTANAKYASINVNGTSYVGGIDNEGYGAWGATGNPAGVTEYNDTNSLTVTGVAGYLAIKNDYPDNGGKTQTTRATLAGMQIKEASETRGYFATLGEGTTAASDATWALQGNEVSYAEITAGDKNLGVTAAANGSTLQLSAGETLSSIAAVGNTVTVVADDAVSVGALYAYEDATLKMGVSLMDGANLSVSGAGVVDLQSANTLGTVWNGGNLTVSGNLTVEAYSGPGSLRVDGVFSQNTGNNANIILSSTGTGKIVINETTVIQGVDLKGDSSRTNTTTAFEGTVSVKGGTLVLGDNGQWNGYWGVNLSSLESIDLDGGNMKLFGSRSDVSVINVNKNASMNIWEATAVEGKGFAIEKIVLNADLTSHATWDSTLSIGVLDGTGNISFTKDRGYNVSIGSIAGCGVITNAVDMVIGTDASSVLNLSNTIKNTGNITISGAVTISEDISGFTMLKVGGDASYSIDGTDGYLVTTGSTYLLLDNDGGSVTFEPQTAVYGNGTTQLVYDEETGDVTFIGGSSEGTIYHVNTTGITIGGDNATANLNRATGFVVAEGQTATIAGGTASLSVVDLLTTTTGKGNITLTTGATLSGAAATQAEGTLSIAAGTQLELGSGDGNTASIASFNKVELDGGSIRFQNMKDTFNNLTTTSKGGSLQLFDMGNAADAVLKLDGKTMLNGDLTVTNTWNAQVDIETLSGSGNLVINGQGRNTADAISVSVNAVDNYSGQVKITNLAEKLSLNVAADLGVNVYVDSHVADVNNEQIKNGIDLTGIGAGNTVTLQGARGYFNKDSNIVADLVLNNSDDGRYAGMELNNGSSNSTNTYSGKISGGGNFVLNTALTNFTQKFTGDVSGWTGRLDIASGNHNIIFTGDASVLNNSDIKMRAEDGTLNLTMEHTKGVTVNAELHLTTGTTNLTLNNSSEAGITFTADVINVSTMKVEAGTKAAFTGVENLTLAGITLNADTQLSIGAQAAGTVGATAATLAGGATVTGNLDLSNATTLTLDGLGNKVVTVTGVLSLNPGENLTLSGDVLTAIAGLGNGEQLNLFAAASYTLPESVLRSTGDAGVQQWAIAEVFGGNTWASGNELYVGYDGAYLYVINNAAPIPEPTTATLSLLALAALASRRRRK